MRVNKVLIAVFGTVLKVFVALVIIAVIYRGAVFGYEYGYRVFAEEPMTVNGGRTVLYTVTEEMAGSGDSETEDEKKAFSIGEIKHAIDVGKQMGADLEKQGLVRDKNLFLIQFLLSEYRVDMKPGEYELSTEMTADEMLKAMTAGMPESKEAQ